MPVQLTTRDRQVLEHLRRFRITTPRVLQKLFCDGSEDSAKKLVQRLRDYIEPKPLYGKNVYYHLKKEGPKLLGAPEEIARPLGPQALPKALGIVCFCCLGAELRYRYTRAEFTEDFPDLADTLVKREYFLDYYPEFDGQHARLGQIMVDLGGDYQKFVSKCRVLVRDGLNTPGLRDIIAEDLFAIAIVVGEEEKRRAVLEAIGAKPFKAWVRCEVVPELTQVHSGKGGDE